MQPVLTSGRLRWALFGLALASAPSCLNVESGAPSVGGDTYGPSDAAPPRNVSPNNPNTTSAPTRIGEVFTSGNSKDYDPNTDWDPNFLKGACPAGSVAVGLSSDANSMAHALACQRLPELGA